MGFSPVLRAFFGFIRSLTPLVVGRPKMLGVMAGMDQKESHAVQRAVFSVGSTVDTCSHSFYALCIRQSLVGSLFVSP